MATATHRVVGTLAESANLSYVPQEHEPVLATELTDILDPKPGETFVDCTFGAGGHARLISERLGSEGELIAVDRDPAAEAALERVRERRAVAHALPARRLRRRPRGAARRGRAADGIVFDLGMSSMQVDAWERGFSYAYDAPLDMRMDPDQRLSAATVVNDWPQDRFANAIREFGEERRAGSIAREIIRRRPIETTAELVTAIKAAMPPAERFGARPPGQAHLPGDPDRRQRRARRARPRPAARLGAAAGRRASRRDLLPLARGPAREALPRRPRPRLRLPARAAGLRLRPRARGRPAHQARDRAGARGDRAQPARGLGAPARRAEGPRGGGRRLMARRRRPHGSSGSASPGRRAASRGAPAAPRAARQARARQAPAGRLMPPGCGRRRAAPAGRRPQTPARFATSPTRA